VGGWIRGVLLVGAGGWVGTKPGFSRRTISSETRPLTATMQSADLLAGKEGTADPTGPIELIEGPLRNSRRRVQKHHIHIFTFYKKSMSKKFPNKSTATSMSVFPQFFCFIAFSVCFSAMGVQKHYKKRFTKKIVSKSNLQKNRQKIPNHFFSFLLITFLGVSR
jgi:hypothetical protein